MRWWLVLSLSVLLGAVALIAAFLTVNTSMDAVTDGIGEMQVLVFGVRLHHERGPWGPLEQKMVTYGWSLIGVYVAVGMLLGAGLGALFRRPATQ